jgi:hypothetical protein
MTWSGQKFPKTSVLRRTSVDQEMGARLYELHEDWSIIKGDCFSHLDLAGNSNPFFDQWSATCFSQIKSKKKNVSYIYFTAG